MDKIHYCIPTYKSFGHCRAAVQAVLAGIKVPDKIIVIDNSGTGAATLHLQSLLDKYSNVYVWTQTENIGVAASWNKFMTVLDEDYVIIANDDVMVHPHTVCELYEAARHEDGMFFAGADGGNAFSLFLLKQEGYRQTGKFDETFYPAYFEDNDYSYRLRLRGIPLIFVNNATYDHVGSSTLKAYTSQEMDQHHRQFRKNRDYYCWKWGGQPGEERYTTPFGV